MPARRDRRPAERLRGRRPLEGALEPRPRRRGEDIQRAHALRVPPSPYPRPVRFDVVVVGGGTAGCVLASRLSENPDRNVCLLEAGPDYGPLSEGRWPSEILDARTTAPTHLWGAGAADGRTLGGKVLGGSSSVNACMAVQGTSADYDEWGVRLDVREPRALPRASAGHAADRTREHWRARPLPPRLRRGGACARLSGPRRPERPRPAGRRRLVSGERRRRSTLERGARLPRRLPCATEPDRAARHSRRPGRPACRIARSASSTRRRRLHEADVVVLAAGAYFSPAILLRSGIGPRGDAGAARATGRGRPPRRRAAPRPLRRQRRVGAVGRPARRHRASGPRRGALRRRTRC